MTKLQFLLSLHHKLSHLPQSEVGERLNFYSEMIEDRMEEGLSEEDAVAAVGSVDEIAAQIAADISPAKPDTKKVTSKRQPKAWEILLLIVGSPLWLSLLITVFSVILSLYISLWSVIISLWAVFGSLIACAVGFVVGGAVLTFIHKFPGIATVGAGIIFAGLSIFMFFGCKAATKGVLFLTKKSATWIKNLFYKKEDA